MIKFPILDGDTKKLRAVPTKYITLEEAVLGGNEFLPIRLGGIVQGAQGTTVNELGKQLLKAASEGDVDGIKLLLMKGAPFTADWLGTSPLHVAAQNNHLEVCEMLLRAGISKDARTKVDRTPLHLAAYEGHLEIVHTLLKHGADSDCKDLLGMTPLHSAVQNGHLDVVRLLVGKGSQTDISNKFDLTPLDIARQLMRVDLIEALTCDASIATQNLVIQLASESGECGTEYPTDDLTHVVDTVPVETVMLEDDMELEAAKSDDDDPDDIHEEHSDVTLPDTIVSQDNSYQDSMKLLQEHGIAMLPHEENNILSTVMESGHSVVLTEVGKEVLDSVKQSEEAVATQNKKIYTMTTEEFLQMTGNSIQKNNGFRPVKVIYKTAAPKRITVKKNKIVPVSTITQLPKLQREEKKSMTDMEFIMSQLVEARKTIEDYKVKLAKKEREAERYKQQLQLLMDAS